MLFYWSALENERSVRLHNKSHRKSSKCQNFLRVWHLVFFRADQLKKTPFILYFLVLKGLKIRKVTLTSRLKSPLLTRHLPLLTKLPLCFSKWMSENTNPSTTPLFLWPKSFPWHSHYYLQPLCVKLLLSYLLLAKRWRYHDNMMRRDFQRNCPGRQFMLF